MITTHSEWLEEYRKDKYKIWIRTTLSNGSEYYLPNYTDWKSVKEICKTNKLSVVKIGLQYRSHHVDIDTSDTDGVYLVKSVLGMMGQNSKQTITIGKIYGNIVKKTMWVTPELIEELSMEDNIEDCFEEAIILNYEKKTRVI
jgi:hypothetical protein